MRKIHYNPTMRFDGKAFAKQIEAETASKVRNLAKKPRVVSVIVGDDPASLLYTRLKKETAERVGVDFEITKLTNKTTKELVKEIAEIGEREELDGVMVQMPIPGLSREEQQEVISAIPLNKDVDGLRWQESGVMPATVRAILSILDRIAMDNGQCLPAQAGTMDEFWKQRFVVVGDRGSVGKPLVHYLRERGASVTGVNSETKEPARRLLAGQVVISCAGRAGLITKEMVGEEGIVIDVGAPTGDMTQGVYAKASVSVEVPGGVGPVTIASLMANVVEYSS